MKVRGIACAQQERYTYCKHHALALQQSAVSKQSKRMLSSHTRRNRIAEYITCARPQAAVRVSGHQRKHVLHRLPIRPQLQRHRQQQAERYRPQLRHSRRDAPLPTAIAAAAVGVGAQLQEAALAEGGEEAAVSEGAARSGAAARVARHRERLQWSHARFFGGHMFGSRSRCSALCGSG